MKKYTIFLLAMILTVSVLTGCGCTNQDMDTMTVPTTLPAGTTTPTGASTAPSTEAATMPTTEATTATQPTSDNGNGAVDGTTGTDGTNPDESGAARGARSNIAR